MLSNNLYHITKLELYRKKLWMDLSVNYWHPVKQRNKIQQEKHILEMFIYKVH